MTSRENIEEALNKKIDKSNWLNFYFTDLVENINEKITPQDSSLKHYIGLSNLDSGSIHIKRFGETESLIGDKLKIYKGDFIFAKRNAYLKRVSLAEFDAIASAHSLVLRSKPENIEPKFLPFFLMSSYFWDKAIKISVGSLSPTINWKQLAKQEFLLPQKEQQLEFAKVFWALDQSIENDLHLLKLIKKAQKSYWYDVKNKYELIRVKDVAKISNGTTPSTSQEVYWKNGTVPWLATGKVHDKFIFNSDKFVTQEAVLRKKSKIFPKGSTLVAMIGQGKTRGSAAKLEIDAAINQNFACVTPKKIDPNFLFYAFSFSYKRLRDISQGTNQLALNCELVGNFKIPYPEIEKQEEASKILLNFEQVINELSNKIKIGKRLQQSLINKVL